MRKTVVNKLVEQAGQNTFFVTGDLGFGAFEPVQNAYGNRYVNVGIAEQNMAGFSAGLASRGGKVYMYSISTFPTLRCLEQIRDDICYHNLDVNILNVGTGFEYGSLGITHHSTEDISCLRCLPNMKVYTPSNASETALVMDEINKENGPSYVRLNKSGANEYLCNSTTINCAKNYFGKTCLVASGTILQEALDYDAENEKHISIFSLVNYFKEKDLIAEKLKSYSNIISLEEHQINGGLYSYLCEIKNEYNLNVKIYPLAIKNEFTSTVGKQKELRNVYGIDKVAIKNLVDKIGEI